jgi:hypothetical protein
MSFSNQPARIAAYDTVNTAEKNIASTDVSVNNDKLDGIWFVLFDWVVGFTNLKLTKSLWVVG